MIKRQGQSSQNVPLDQTLKPSTVRIHGHSICKGSLCKITNKIQIKIFKK